MKEHPRCSNCPNEATCPHGKQLCDHEACSLHPHEERWVDDMARIIIRNDEKEFDHDDND